MKRGLEGGRGEKKTKKPSTILKLAGISKDVPLWKTRGSLITAKCQQKLLFVFGSQMRLWIELPKRAIDIILLVSARHRHGCSAKIFIRGREKAASKKALGQIELQAGFTNEQWNLEAGKFSAVTSFEVLYFLKREKNVR